MEKNKYLILFFIINFLLINIAYGEKINYFLTLKYNKVKVRSGPSLKHPVKFIYNKKLLPVKIIDTHDKFRNIIDLNNNSGWIHISQLTRKKSAINIKNNSIIYKKPTIFSKPLAKIETGKLLLVKKCKIEWCKINFNNYNGWIKKNYLSRKVN